MNKTNILWIAFGVTIIAQWAAPIDMIVRANKTLTGGQVFKFKTQPVDPEDAFKGRFILLSFDAANLNKELIRGTEFNESFYALLETGPDGFARIQSVRSSAPASGAYVKCRNQWGRYQLPFDRFYMNETLAPEAERAYREHNQRGKVDAYALVRVLNGEGVIENVYLGDKPIAEYVRAKSK